MTARFLTITDKPSRFSETESVAFLTLTVSKYKISVKEEPQFAYETFEQRKTRVLNCTDTITTTYVSFFIVYWGIDVSFQAYSRSLDLHSQDLTN